MFLYMIDDSPDLEDNKFISGDFPLCCTNYLYKTLSEGMIEKKKKKE